MFSYGISNAHVMKKGRAVAQCLTPGRGPGLEPHQRHCIVVLEQDTFILA